MAAERLHGDDTTAPVLTKGKTDTGRLWIYLWTVPAMQGLLRQFWQTLGCSYLFGLCRNVVADLDEIRGLAPNYVGGLSEPDRSSGFSQFRSDRFAIITPIALAQPKLLMRGYEAVARSVDMTAHAIRAVLFASATVATLKCRRPKRPEIQALCT